MAIVTKRGEIYRADIQVSVTGRQIALVQLQAALADWLAAYKPADSETIVGKWISDSKTTMEH